VREAGQLGRAREFEAWGVAQAAPCEPPAVVEPELVEARCAGTCIVDADLRQMRRLAGGGRRRECFDQLSGCGAARFGWQRGEVVKWRGPVAGRARGAERILENHREGLRLRVGVVACSRRQRVDEACFAGRALGRELRGQVRPIHERE